MAVKKELSKLDKIQEMKDKINSKFGKDKVYRVGDNLNKKIPTISTGIKTLDFALGGGFPKGRIVELYGNEGCSKTSLANTVIAQAQKAGGYAAFIDAECGYNEEYAKNLGVNIDELIVANPVSTEEAFKILEEMLKTNSFDVVVFDSIAALASESELSGEIGQATVALNARLISSVLRRITTLISSSNTCVIFINQLRSNLSITGYGGGGDITPGGKALKYYSSLRLEMKKLSSIKKGDQIIGNKLVVKAVKNRLAPPYKVVTLEYLFKTGFSIEGMVIDLAIESGIIKKAGAWLFYKDKKFNGKEALRLALATNSELANELDKQVDEFINTGKVSLPEDVEEGDAIEERKQALDEGDIEEVGIEIEEEQ